jgi:hypothetical protein
MEENDLEASFPTACLLHRLIFPHSPKYTCVPIEYACTSPSERVETLKLLIILNKYPHNADGGK